MPLINVGNTVNPSQSVIPATDPVVTPQSNPNVSNSLQFSPVQGNDTYNQNYTNQDHIQLNSPVVVNQNTNGVRQISSPSDTNYSDAPLSKESSDIGDELKNKLPNLPSFNLGGSQAALIEEMNRKLNNTKGVSIPKNNVLVNNVEELNTKQYSLRELLKEAVNMGASDLHLTVGYRAIVRVNGVIKSISSSLLDQKLMEEYVKEVLKNRTIKPEDDLSEIDLTYTQDNRRFRVNVFRQMGTPAIVFRVIPDTILSLDELELPEVLKEFSNFPNGLVLVTGPTGSGKSTTIASILNLINLTQPKHIITLEDPVEYVFPKGLSLIDQREYGIDFKSWPNALRSVLRQDPDIVLIGEMRDLETIESAIRVAETGHLVFATLHTNSAPESIDRIIDVFTAEKQEQIRIQLASVIRAVITQRLVKVINGGRLPAIELMFANPGIRNAIREKKVYQIDNMIQTSSDVGMISMEKSLVNLIKQGRISIETAKSVSLKPGEIEILMQKYI